MNNDEGTLREWFVRLETKLDLVIGQHDAKLNDHEERIRRLEIMPTVSPKGLTAAIASTVTILVALLTLLDQLTIK